MRRLELAIKYLAGERLRGTAAERLALTTEETNAAPHWQLLGRSGELSSSATDLTVTGITPKPYMMLLYHTLGDGGTVRRYVRFNNQSGGSAQYAGRFSTDGGSSSTSSPNADGILGHNDGDDFSIANVNQIMQSSTASNQEKVAIIKNCTIPASGNTCSTREIVGKWTNTSDTINRVDIYNTGANYVAGSELVVLGYDPADTSGTSAWAELASETASSGDAITATLDSTKKYLWVQCIIQGSSDGKWRFGNGSVDPNDNYSQVDTANGGGYAGNNGRDNLECTYGSGYQLIEMFIINKANEKKLVIGHVTSIHGSTGGSNIPNRKEFAGRWDNTSDQMDIISCYGWGTISTATLKVWGFD